MKHNTNHWYSSSIALAQAPVTALILWLFAAVPASIAKPPPPASRTYFVTTLGIGAPLEMDAACLEFKARRVCLDTLDPIDPAFCGTWSVTDDGAEERGASIEIEWDAGGILLGIDGQFRVDNRGQGSSIGGTGLLAARELDVQRNWSFSGTQTKRKKCRRLGREFKQLAHQWTATQCLTRARFGSPGSSPYVLPYPVGDSHRIGQVYCEPTGSHRDSFAYDINMPVGSPIVAVRDGVVWMVLDEFEDGDTESEHSNDIFIEHADGSVAQYAHLQHRSFLVQPGDSVVAGQEIAAAGDTGIPLAPPHSPHLHFEVHRSRVSFDSLPVNFRNAGGPVDERGGLVLGETYEALPY